MTDAVLESLCEPVLLMYGIPHGFGQRRSQVPDFTLFPTQVHGTRAVDVSERTAESGTRVKAQADTILSDRPGASVGIVTADCVPILVASRDGRSVAAIHAGWRGLAAGVIEAGVQALRGKMRGKSGTQELSCAIGPSARGCCYEVDEPVRAGLNQGYAPQLSGVLTPGRSPGHFQLDLPRLATRVLESLGIERDQIGTENRICTICAPERFESYRRDGVAAGRLRHFISVAASIPRQG